MSARKINLAQENISEDGCKLDFIFQLFRQKSMLNKYSNQKVTDLK